MVKKMNEEEKQAIEKLKSIVKVNKDFLKGVENQTINQEEIKSIEIALNMIESLLWKEGNQKELLKYKTDVIEKQQKQIEEVKKEKRILIEKYTDVVYECVKRNKKIEFLKKRLYRKGVFSKEKFIRFYPKQYQNKVVKIWVNECDGLTPREMEELGYDVLEECLI